MWHEGMARCLDGRQHNMVHSGCACGNGAAMVASRDVIRAGIESANLKRDQMMASYMAELKESLFNDLEASMLQSASLLLSKLQAAHKQAAPFDLYRDGVGAWEELERTYGITDRTASGRGQRARCRELIALQLKPLAVAVGAILLRCSATAYPSST